MEDHGSSRLQNDTRDAKLEGHTPGPWVYRRVKVQGGHSWSIGREEAGRGYTVGQLYKGLKTYEEHEANARLIAAAPDLLEALREGRRAIGDHWAPNDCYATGPVTGDPIRDLVQCPACSFIAMYEAAIAKATGESPQ